MMKLDNYKDYVAAILRNVAMDYKPPNVKTVQGKD